MITAKNFAKAIQAQTDVMHQVRIRMINALFTFIGADNDNIYFGVACDLNETNESEIKDLKEKTRFLPIEESKDCGFYHGIFSVAL